jgi:hypothetical protein
MYDYPTCYNKEYISPLGMLNKSMPHLGTFVAYLLHLSLSYCCIEDWVFSEKIIYFRDFYFRALGSLVVLSFPQLLSFSSVLSKPLSETLTSAGTAGCPTVPQL